MVARVITPATVPRELFGISRQSWVADKSAGTRWVRAAGADMARFAEVRHPLPARPLPTTEAKRQAGFLLVPPQPARDNQL